MEKWYCFLFEDGTKEFARGFSKTELRYEEQQHGKLISKTLA